MSSVIVPMGHQQQQQPQPQQQHGVAISGQNDPLFSALVKYVTTGKGASHTTEADLQQLAASFVNRPGGRAHLEALCQDDQPHPERTLWKNKAAANGFIKLSKTELGITISIPSLDVNFSGSAQGFYRPYSGPLHNGTLWYNGMDNLQPGPADFQLHVDDLTLYVDIYRNQVFVASFTCYPIAFVLAPGTTDGSGNFS